MRVRRPLRTPLNAVTTHLSLRPNSVTCENVRPLGFEPRTCGEAAWRPSACTVIHLRRSGEVWCLHRFAGCHASPWSVGPCVGHQIASGHYLRRNGSVTSFVVGETATTEQIRLTKCTRPHARSQNASSSVGSHVRTSVGNAVPSRNTRNLVRHVQTPI